MKEEVRKYRESKLKNDLTHYGLKYALPMVMLTHRELMQSVYRFEMKHMNKLIQNGIDPITKEYGYFLIS